MRKPISIFLMILLAMLYSSCKDDDKNVSQSPVQQDLSDVGKNPNGNAPGTNGSDGSNGGDGTLSPSDKPIDFNHPMIVDTVEGHSFIKKERAEKILTGAEPLVIEFSHEVDEQSLMDKIVVDFDDQILNCQDNMQVEGKTIYCHLQAPTSGDEQSLNLTSGESSFHITILRGVQSIDGSEKLEQDFSKELMVADALNVSLTSGNSQLSLSQEKLDSLVAPEDVAITYSLNFDGKLSERQIKNAMILVLPNGKLRKIKHVRLASESDNSVIPSHNNPANMNDSSMTNNQQTQVVVEVTKEDLMGQMTQVPSGPMAPPSEPTEPTQPTEPTEPAPGNDADDGLIDEIDLFVSSFMNSEEETSHAQILTGEYKLIIRKGLHSHHKALFEDQAIATLTVEGGQIDSPATDDDSSAVKLMPAEGTSMENNQLLLENAGEISLIINKNGESLEAFAEGLSSAAFKVQRYKDESYSTTEGEAFNPSDVKVEADKKKVTLTLPTSTEAGANTLSPGFYEITVVPEQLEAGTMENIENIEPLRFEVTNESDATTTENPDDILEGMVVGWN